MTKLVALALAAACFSGPAWALQRQGTSGSLVIDGSKNPELFPEWFIWQQTFIALDRDGSNARIPVHVELGVSETEAQYLMTEVKGFQDLQAILAKQIREARSTLTAQNKPEGQIRDAIQAHELEYRYKLLEARQRIYEKLSPESMVGLRGWIDRRMSGTKAHLRGRALQYFHLPW